MHAERSGETQPSRPKRVRRSTGPYKAADATREAILDTAIEHFAAWGFFNSSVPKIAAEVGLTKTGLLHHFGSKEGLLEAVLELREQRGTQAFFDLDQIVDPIDYFEQIAAQAAFNETQPGLTQMFSILAAEAANPEHPAHDYFEQRYRRIIDASAGILHTAVSAGSLRPDVDPEQLASEIIGVLDGFVVQWGLARPQFSLHARVRSYLDRLARSITSDARGLSAQ